MSPLEGREQVFREALEIFWRERIQHKGKPQADTHMRGFEAKIESELKKLGLIPKKEIYIRSKSILPGYFRATKNWDIVVISKDILIAAIELKSMVGSAAKNVNNRAEEVLGVACDFKTAFRKNPFH